MLLRLPSCRIRVHFLALALYSLQFSTAIGRILHQEQPKETNTEASLYPRTCEEAFVNNRKGRESKSCSLGVTKPFIRALDTWADVRAMLEARSYKGEIILTHETRIDVAAQWQWRMLRMGYAHTVVVTRGEFSCGPLRNLYGDQLGCVWFRNSVWYPGGGGGAGGGGATGALGSMSDALGPGGFGQGGGFGAAFGAGGNASWGALLQPGQVGLFLESPMYWRFQLAALILRVGGYNLLSLDSDTLMMDDFYWWMNQPDYLGYQLLSQLDSATGGLNVGVMYVRGAAPGGPTAWALADALLRNVRWKEQPQLLAGLNITSHICWDQAVLTDSVFSALVGRPIFPRCLEARLLDPSWSTREDGRKRFVSATESLTQPALETKVFSMDRSGPRCHASSLEGAPGGLTSLQGRLVMPHFAGVWPDVLGGRALGPAGQELGPVAAAYLQMMREAGTPMWPDPEDPASRAAAAAVPPERFTGLSRHLVCDWSGCGHLGMYQPGLRAAGEEPCVVIGHVSQSPDATPGRRFQLMANGQYSMRLAEAAHGPGGPYFATNPQHGGGAGTHHAAVRMGHLQQLTRRGGVIPLPHVVTLLPSALSPGPSAAAAAAAAAGRDGRGRPVVLSSKEHMIGLVQALGTVAIAAGRALGLPRLSCDFPWMHRTTGDGGAGSGGGGGGNGSVFPGSHRVPWTYLRGEAFTPWGPSPDRLSCEWLAWVQSGCLHGPMHVERPGRGHVTPHPAARMLLSYEMDYLLSQLPEADRAPSPPATATTAGSGRNVVSVPAGAVAGPDGVYNITTDQLTEQLAGIGPDRTVVWLAAPLRVVDLAATQQTSYTQWARRCCGLSWPDSVNHICFGSF